MQRIALPKTNLTPTFIGSWVIEPLSLCDELIAYFETHMAEQKRGTTAAGRNLDAKDRSFKLIDVMSDLLKEEVRIEEQETMKGESNANRE